MVENKLTILVKKNEDKIGFLEDSLYSLTLIKEIKFEVVIVSESSTDEELIQLIEKMSNYFTISIYKSKFKNVLDRFNEALTNVENEYALLIDDSTVILPDLNFLIKELKDKKELNLAYGDIKASKLRLKNSEFYTYTKELRRIDTNLNKFDLIFNPVLYLEACLFRTESFNTAEFDKNFHYYQRWKFIKDILLKDNSKILHVEKFVVLVNKLDKDKNFEAEDFSVKEKELIWDEIYTKGISLIGDDLKSLKEKFDRFKDQKVLESSLGIKKEMKNFIKRVIKK
ncbi:MAG: glycosyltransferase family A protein [Candidatus Dojkabacteria bacterium]|nr:glycosyltransferase family A protein [Candidatus Dojkabacteria bacterium]MDQ7020225.1 glycosyltransferase family A protein [Candidatus Dojkabacteria bacterium]